jgi:uncharacterized protein YxeA
MKKILFAIIILMFLMTACNFGAVETSIYEPSSGGTTNIQKAKYYLKMAESTGVISHSENYLKFAETYLLMEAVEKGIILEGTK